METPAQWLARVRHDLVKRLLWPARDRKDMGGTPAPGELVPQLLDDEGRATSASALWQALRQDATAGSDAHALDEFGRALDAAVAAAAAANVDGVLALDEAFARLARIMNRVP